MVAEGSHFSTKGPVRVPTLPQRTDAGQKWTMEQQLQDHVLVLERLDTAESPRAVVDKPLNGIGNDLSAKDIKMPSGVCAFW